MTYCRSSIAVHIGNVFEEGEFDQSLTCRKFQQVQDFSTRRLRTSTKQVLISIPPMKIPSGFINGFSKGLLSGNAGIEKGNNGNVEIKYRMVGICIYMFCIFKA